ncbi:MAG: VOC family protein [Woeseia sp.]
MNLNQVTLPARNIPESVAFYKKLGLIQITDADHYARFECPDGDSTFSVHVAQESALGGMAVVYFEHEDLDAFCEELQGKGLEFLQLPRDEQWLWREARLKDPSGNTICLYWAGENRKDPHWRINR